MSGDNALRILVIEDQESDFLLVERFLARQLPNAHLHRVTTREDLRAALALGGWDMVLSDYNVPGMDFEENLDLIQDRLPHKPVILLSGSVGDEQAVSLVKKGVWDFVLKDNLIRLPPAIRRGVQEAAEHRARADAETASREAENALRTLVNAIPESALLAEMDGTIVAANETIARRYGKLARQLIGMKLLDLFPPEVRETRMAHIEASIRSGEPLRFEDRRLGRYIENYVHPIKDEHGRVKRLAILGVDVTEHRAVLEKAREQAALLDIASDAILVSDLEDRTVYWSKGAERVYGWSASECTGRMAAELMFSESHIAEAHAARATALENGAWSGDLHQRTKDGAELIVEGRCTLMLGEDGRPTGILWVNTDVTAQRSIQAQLLRSQRLESLGTLAGGIAHDLNNVLSPIMMGVEGLSFHDADPATQKILDIIKTSAQRGANIVRQILNFARGMEGKIGEVQVKHILREVEGIVQETFQRSIMLKTEIPRDLWPVMGDATQLHQVLMNLCVNARDAMPGGGELTIEASNVQLDEAYSRLNVDARPIRYVVMEVEDSGSGIAPELLDKIFDPFFTTKAPGQGTGLGLSTVRSIVQSHGGFVHVYSQVGKGTSFKVYIPAAEQGDGTGAAAPSEQVPTGLGQLILVVEDEVSLRDITRQILESYNYRVVTAPNGTEALVTLGQKPSDVRLVITDMMMPFMDGASMIRAIRKIDAGLPIIATSGLTSGEQSREARSLGVQAFLPKPYASETLLRAVRDVLSGAPVSVAEGAQE